MSVKVKCVIYRKTYMLVKVKCVYIEKHTCYVSESKSKMCVFI